jgi:hypothetical protein
MFPDKKASYETANLSGLTLLPRDEDLPELRKDYAAMEVMFAGARPKFDELVEGLAELQGQLRDQGVSGDNA